MDKGAFIPSACSEGIAIIRWIRETATVAGYDPGTLFFNIVQLILHCVMHANRSKVTFLV